MKGNLNNIIGNAAGELPSLSTPASDILSRRDCSPSAVCWNGNGEQHTKTVLIQKKPSQAQFLRRQVNYEKARLRRDVDVSSRPSSKKILKLPILHPRRGTNGIWKKADSRSKGVNAWLCHLCI